MTPEWKKIIELTEKHTEKLVSITSRYERAIGTLDKARREFERQKTSLWERLIQLLPLIVPIIVLLMLGYILNNMPCGTSLKYQGIELTRSCK